MALFLKSSTCLLITDLHVRPVDSAIFCLNSKGMNLISAADLMEAELPVFVHITIMAFRRYCVGGCRHSPNTQLTAIRWNLAWDTVHEASRSMTSLWQVLPVNQTVSDAHLLLWRHRAFDRCQIMLIDRIWQNLALKLILANRRDFKLKFVSFNTPWVLLKIICARKYNFLTQKKPQKFRNADTFCWFLIGSYRQQI